MKRRISISRLGQIHATVKNPTGAHSTNIRLEEAEGLLFGETFAETLDLNRDNLDLYESHPEILRITPVGKVLVKWA